MYRHRIEPIRIFEFRWNRPSRAGATVERRIVLNGECLEQTAGGRERAKIDDALYMRVVRHPCTSDHAYRVAQ